MSNMRPAFNCTASVAAGIALGYFASRVTQYLFSRSTCTTEPSSNDGELSKAAILLEAASFSAEKHKDQRRKNSKQVPYICHPIRVARSLAVDAGVDNVNVLVAALLHDTVEDTDATLEEIEALFGPEVAKIVDEVSDDKALPSATRKQLQIEHAPHVSPEAKHVKLADKLDNLTDLLVDTPIGWQPERVATYFDWAGRVIAGLRGTNQVLESKLDAVLAKKEVALNAAAGCV